MSLISAERLHRWKCAFCGSKDKNIVNYMIPDESYKKNPNASQFNPGVKIVTCNQCGYSMIFAHSALVLGNLIAGDNKNRISIQQSDDFVKQFHHINHDDPKKHPQVEEDIKLEKKLKEYEEMRKKSDELEELRNSKTQLF